MKIKTQERLLACGMTARPPSYAGTDRNLGGAAKSASKTAATVTDRELCICNQPPFICPTKRDQTGDARFSEGGLPGY